VALIKETYPRLYDKIPDFDEQSTKFIQKIKQITTEKDFDIVPKNLLQSLKMGILDYSIDYKKYDKTKYGIFLFKEKESWVYNIKEIDSTVIGKK
jgi:hypothetical protein